CAKVGVTSFYDSGFYDNRFDVW
nr:immunoglobulin heavy chain junction region [Macaca mulatta]